jgi:hypothetical protein
MASNAEQSDNATIEVSSVEAVIMLTLSFAFCDQFAKSIFTENYPKSIFE